MKLRLASHLGSVTLLLATLSSAIPAAQGEMGIGVPSNIGLYSAATGVNAFVWLSDVAVAIPATCGYLVLSSATMGMDAYKLAIATLLMANASSKRVRFYAHAQRDGGCGIDYVQITQ